MSSGEFFGTSFTGANTIFSKYSLIVLVSAVVGNNLPVCSIVVFSKLISTRVRLINIES